MTKKKQQSPQAADALRDQLTEMEGRYKRALADYQNLEKRQQNQATDLVKYAAETILDKLIPILENLQRAQAHLSDPGLEMVAKQFADVLESEGIKPIETKDADFNPETMDCAELVDGPKNKVVNTISGGYYFFDKVLRPARVTVGKGKDSSGSRPQNDAK